MTEAGAQTIFQKNAAGGETELVPPRRTIDPFGAGETAIAVLPGRPVRPSRRSLNRAGAAIDREVEFEPPGTWWAGTFTNRGPGRRTTLGDVARSGPGLIAGLSEQSR